jgi:ADP-heptose:LPS heptosyltransferase
MWRLNGRVGPLEFSNESEQSRYEFRVFLAGRPLSGALRFSGVYLQQFNAATGPRFRPVELHVGEQLSLLVELIKQRTTDIYTELRPDTPALPEALERLLAVPAGTKRIAVAPLSNSTVRDWPMENYAELVSLLLGEFDCRVFLLGSGAQAEAAERIRRECGNERVVNLAGRTRWSDLASILRVADLLVCNNSGIAHQGARLGVPTLAIYSASHQPQEWGPRGPNAVAIMASVPCSPCGYEQVERCPNEHACMRLITPADVLARARLLLADPEGSRDLPDEHPASAERPTGCGRMEIEEVKGAALEHDDARSAVLPREKPA